MEVRLRMKQLSGKQEVYNDVVKSGSNHEIATQEVRDFPADHCRRTESLHKKCYSPGRHAYHVRLTQDAYLGSLLPRRVRMLS